MLYYGIPTYSQFDHCRKAVKALHDESSIVPDQIVIIDNSGTGKAALALEDVLAEYSRVHIIPRTRNILAGAWNDIMNLFPEDNIIIANDDVIPHYDTIKKLVDCVTEHPEYAMVNGSGDSGNSYSFFLLKKWAYAQIGAFDECFRPAYFEDNDYDWRIKLLGLIRYTVVGATFDHVGSATVNAMPDTERRQAHINFRNNNQYYIRKWGGNPGEEKDKVPFASLGLEEI